MWNWVSADSFRETAGSYVDLGLITKLISAHLRSCSRSSDYSYHTFALVRDSSITQVNKTTMTDQHLLQDGSVRSCLWVDARAGTSQGDEWMIMQGTCHTRLQSLYCYGSVSLQGIGCLWSRTAAWLQYSVLYPCVQNLLRLESYQEKCWKSLKTKGIFLHHLG